MTPARSYLVGLIGAGVGPSLTPAMHMREARHHGLDYVYRTLDISELGYSPDRVGELLHTARALGYDAFNITHPGKQLVIEHLDRLDATAARLGAVNTVVFEDGESVGYNTDTTGFARALRTGLPDVPTRRVVQLGAGGAGTAVSDALLSHGVEHLTLVDLDTVRSERLAAELAERFPNSVVEASHPDKVETLLTLSDGVVNCTPMGMVEHPGLPLDAGLLRADLWVADIVYFPFETALLRAAADAGARTLHGGHMAAYQAADAFGHITGLEADPERVLSHLRELTAAR
ncbi:shikimate dehydrogenase [Nocardioides insulae]|uniref:shikimate dehydrogenase n=1 Tax=Nocardioides insulae TaxID=394734 RepID=UPI0004022723|nr:shikimate dehydrogenase [Nocardioides insulae]